MLPQIYLPIGWSTYFFSAARVEPFQPEEVARARSEVRPAAGQFLVKTVKTVKTVNWLYCWKCFAGPCVDAAALALYLAARAAGLSTG